jgi:hypothetical protein
MQLPLPLIPRTYHGAVIEQRVRDGYINATAMCKAAGKLVSDYVRVSSTKAFLAELSTDMGIPISELVQSVKGGVDQGTWVHPDVAIHLAQWLSPKFAVQVSKWVREWISTGKSPIRAQLPYHLRRYMANRIGIPHTHFSILTEMMQTIVAPLEQEGYTLPEKLLPGISEGRMFCRWLREVKGVDTNALPTYAHKYEDGRVVHAKLYPIELLADFRRHLHEVWIPQRAVDYFRERDANALPYLPKLLPPPTKVA